VTVNISIRGKKGRGGYENWLGKGADLVMGSEKRKGENVCYYLKNIRGGKHRLSPTLYGGKKWGVSLVGKGGILTFICGREKKRSSNNLILEDLCQKLVSGEGERNCAVALEAKKKGGEGRKVPSTSLSKRKRDNFSFTL